MKNEVLYFCEECAKGVMYALNSVEKCVVSYGKVLCRACKSKLRTKNGNIRNAD